MTTIHFSRLPPYIVLSLWATLGFAGGIVALLTMLRIAGLDDPFFALLPFAAAGVGVNLLCFFGGLTLGMVSLWGMHAGAMHAQQSGTHS